MTARDTGDTSEIYRRRDLPIYLAALGGRQPVPGAISLDLFAAVSVFGVATPDALRGRVSAVNMLFIGASGELGTFESGVAAALVGTVPSVVLGGLLTLVVAVVWMGALPALRRADRLSSIRL